jgi:hypothetical protein
MSTRIIAVLAAAGLVAVLAVAGITQATGDTASQDPAAGTAQLYGLEAAQGAPAQDCAIKGNISRSGERIYHVPGGSFYERTKINEGAGEKLFCSEEEAAAAGWRRSLR